MITESIERKAPVVLPLDDSAATLEGVGGKGASLARMAAAGLPVPPGFHITTAAYRHFVDANELQKGILAAVTAVNPDVAASLELASARVQRLFAGANMPDDLAGAMRQAYLALGGDLPVAVRSSATAEDLPGLSFAGQQETYLNIRGAEAVLEAVKNAGRRSGRHGPSAIAFRTRSTRKAWLWRWWSNSSSQRMPPGSCLRPTPLTGSVAR